jgi:biotin synthase-like enzyme
MKISELEVTELSNDDLDSLLLITNKEKHENKTITISNLLSMMYNEVVVQCQYCGQPTRADQPCRHCGAPPKPAKERNE